MNATIPIAIGEEAIAACSGKLGVPVNLTLAKPP
jgi:hypothetical protein